MFVNDPLSCCHELPYDAKRREHLSNIHQKAKNAIEVSHEADLLVAARLRLSDQYSIVS